MWSSASGPLVSAVPGQDAHCVLGKDGWRGEKARLVPSHPELKAALRMTINYRMHRDERLILASRATASRWIEEMGDRTAGVLSLEPHGTSHTLRHQFARHVLTNRVPINLVSRAARPAVQQACSAAKHRSVPKGAGVVSLEEVHLDVEDLPS